jgi:hypothetical protein
MNKLHFLGTVCTFFVAVLSTSVNAALVTIGTASYLGTDYNLIWDDDNNGNSIVWLDYTNGKYTDWGTQSLWAAGLDSALSLNLSTGYTVTWTDSQWRLPATWVAATGYNITTSELGHLYYDELGNSADTISPFNPDFGIFDSLSSQNYWANAGSSGDTAYYFHMGAGSQSEHWKVSQIAGGLAVRAGDVSTVVPVPAALWLFGSGLIGLAAMARRKKES